MSCDLKITTFASGSSGNCVLVSCGDEHILIDAGISMKRVRDNLRLSGVEEGSLRGILVTHEHFDHIGGLKMLAKYCKFPVYAPGTVANNLRRTTTELDDVLNTIPVGESFDLGMCRVTAFPTPHDTPQSVGYRIDFAGVSFALATDMGHVTPEIENMLLGCDAVLIECNHDVERIKQGPYPYYLKKRILSPNGHLCNDDCAVLARKLAENGTRYIILGHLSRENNTPALAMAAVKPAVEDTGIMLVVAPADSRLTVEVSPCCQ